MAGAFSTYDELKEAMAKLMPTGMIRQITKKKKLLLAFQWEYIERTGTLKIYASQINVLKISTKSGSCSDKVSLLNSGFI